MVQAAAEGDRAWALNKAGCCLGRLIAAGALPEEVAEAALIDGCMYYATSACRAAVWSPSTAYLVIFHKAREAAFTEAEAESLAAQRPYDLRHACVSTWLNATGDPAQVAEWAGHTVDVLLRVYAKCISGRQEAAKRRIFDATRPLKAPARRTPPARSPKPPNLGTYSERAPAQGRCRPHAAA